MRMTSRFLQGSQRRSSRRRATNVTVRPEYVAEAKALGISLSEVFEQALGEAIQEAAAARWVEENRNALDSYNQFVERHGLPLEGLRLF